MHKFRLNELESLNCIARCMHESKCLNPIKIMFINKLWLKAKAIKNFAFSNFIMYLKCF